MKRFRYIIVLAWVTGIVSACTDLDTKMNNQWSVDDTWTNAEKAQGVLLSVYQDVLTVPDAWDGNFLDAATDNAMTRVYDSSVYRAGQGGFAPNAESTIKKKGSDQPLIDTGYMRQSVNYVVKRRGG